VGGAVELQVEGRAVENAGCGRAPSPAGDPRGLVAVEICPEEARLDPHAAGGLDVDVGAVGRRGGVVRALRPLVGRVRAEALGAAVATRCDGRCLVAGCRRDRVRP